MRVLARFVGGPGHLLPQVPLLRALLAAGGEVAVHGSPRAIGLVRGLGAELLVEPEEAAPRGGAIRPLAPVDMQAEHEVIAEHFAGPVARDDALTVSAVIERWQPEVVVCDDIDFGAMLAAERAGLPSAIVQVIASGALVLPELVGPALDERRRELGLPSDRELRMLHGSLLVSPFPQSFRDPAFPLPPDTIGMRPEGGAAADGRGVYATLGTEFPRESGDLLNRIVTALGLLGGPALLTVGRDLDPADFPAPPPVRVERFVPQREALAASDVMVHHGGSGAVTGAIAAGVPQVVLALGADQPLNARRVAELGLGASLDALAASPSEIADAVERVRDDAEVLSAVRRMREELLALPDPALAAEAVLALIR